MRAEEHRLTVYKVSDESSGSAIKQGECMQGARGNTCLNSPIESIRMHG